MENKTNYNKELILVADDDGAFANAFSQMLQLRGYLTRIAVDENSVYKALDRDRFDLLTLDLDWGSNASNGIDILRRVLAKDLLLPVIILTSHASIDSAVQAIKLGAFDYLEKAKDTEKSFITIKNAIKSGLLLRENQRMLDLARSQFPIIGASGKTKELKEHISRVGSTDCSVLITGATGTGKELVARHIHYAGKRRNDKFIPVDVASLPADLVESTLFGYKKGAFTGALQDQQGYFDEADKGTIFLDEISNIPINTQAKLLRVLQSGEYYPVGSTELKTCDVRIIAATNKNLEEMIRSDYFRMDLYYRINEYEIKMPLLDDRKEDIPLLAKHFVNINSRIIKGYPMQISAEGINLLIEKQWPGNVRQLENAIKRVIIFARDHEITQNDLLASFEEKQETDGQLQTLEAVTKKCRKEHIIKVLNSCHGNISKAAELLEVDRAHLYRLLTEYQIKQLAKEFR